MVKPARAVLFLPAATFAAGILFSSKLHFDRDSLLGALPVLCALWIVARGWVSALACGAVLLVAGCLIEAVHRVERPPELEAESGEVVLLSGCIVEPVTADGVQSRFVLELEAGARARVTLTARDSEVLPVLNYGQSIEIEARVRKPKNFRNPGSFDYVRYLARQQVYWVASARGVAAVRVLPAQCGSEVRRHALWLAGSLSGKWH